MEEKFKMGGVFTICCYDKDGKLKWKREAKNRVCTAGQQHALDVLFAGGTQVNPWYVGLIDNAVAGDLVAGDTLASHAGWTENSNYSGDRKEFVDVRSSQTVSNSASKASFAISVDAQTLSGAFLCSAATGTTGTLLSEAVFTGGNESAGSTDTVEVQYNFTGADDGV